jgi:hypothetical protein
VKTHDDSKTAPRGRDPVGRFGGRGSAEPGGVQVQRVFNWVLGLAGYIVYLFMKPASETVKEAVATTVEEPEAVATPG